MPKFKIQDIRPNPFRNLDSYPIRRDKVNALRESLRATGFWDNVVARLDADGFPELAYGHHRLAALREEYPPDHEVNLIIKDLPNDQMLKIMARENMDEYGSNAMIDMETVRATLDAYADGVIDDMPQPESGFINSNTGYHSSTQFADRDGETHNKPYNAQTIARYLGWMITDRGDLPDRPNHQKVQVALRGLRLVDDGLADLDDFEGFNVRTQSIVVQHACNAKGAEEVQQILQMAKNVVNEGGGHPAVDREIRQHQLAEPVKRVKHKSKDMNLSLLREAMAIEKLLGADDQTERRIASALSRRKDIKPDTIKRLDEVLTALIERANEIRNIVRNP